MRNVEPCILVSEWDAALMALSQNGMDVSNTFYAIQTKWFQPLYKYVYGEYTAVTKTDMEIKKIIKSEDHYPDAARDFDDLDSASNFLNKECPICGDTLPIHEVTIYF